MKNKRDIYCEYLFWESFFEMENSILRDRSKRKLWDAFYEFLTNNNIFFDVPQQAIKEETPGGANLIKFLMESGGAGLNFIPKEFPKFSDLSDSDNNHLNSVFLTISETSVCNSLSKRFGILVFNLPMIFSSRHIYDNNGTTFDVALNRNWDYLMDLREMDPSIGCCNSLVIVDRYLFYDRNHNTIRNNIKPIFEALLPWSLDNDIRFNICIIAENNCHSIEKKIDILTQLVENLRPDLSFSINIFDSNIIHDRAILTNNIILTSGAGFDIIGNNGRPIKFTTTSLYFPFLMSEKNSDEYLNWIYNILKVERDCRSYSYNYWGEEYPTHHLLDHYYEKPKETKSQHTTRATYSLGAIFAEVLSHGQ